MEVEYRSSHTIMYSHPRSMFGHMWNIDTKRNVLGMYGQCADVESDVKGVKLLFMECLYVSMSVVFLYFILFFFFSSIV